jgi:ATPase subunit of ABC transporter with duplicated ATPase domains
VNFAGCAVVISHDRWFDRIATHMIAFEGDSRVVWFEGNYQTTKSTGTAGSETPISLTGSSI